MMSENKVIESLYLHVSNSGATFSVVDLGYGPVVRIETSAFGNLAMSVDVITDTNALKALSEMFAKAAEHSGYSEDYCNKATK